MFKRKSTTFGFKTASSVLSNRIQNAGQSRGFGTHKVLTQWGTLAPPDLVDICKPVEVSYGRGAFGATLTILTSGAHAPVVEMQKEALRERVNAVYGYNAIQRIRITQTAAQGFDGPKRQARRTVAAPSQHSKQVAQVSDDNLRTALAQLEAQIGARKETTA